MFRLPRSTSDASLFRRYLELTMPPGALEALFQPVLKILAQRTQPHQEPLKLAGLLFAGDHAVARRHGVSAFPAEVTPQMVANIVRGGAAVSQLAQRRAAPLWVCDVGIAQGFDSLLAIPSNENVHFERANLHGVFPSDGFGEGARDITTQAALSLHAHQHCWDVGARLAEEAIRASGCDVVFLGEMGIGNTTPASAISAYLLGMTADACTGRGTGVSDAVWQSKKRVVEMALERVRKDGTVSRVQSLNDAHVLLQELGGAELSALAGAAWRAAEMGRMVLLDGVIVTAAVAPFAIAEKSFSAWLLASHESAEPVHKSLLHALGLNPLLKLGLRLGEGSGAALAAGLLQDADALLRGMATFSSAGVSSGDSL